jgi:hypothetical protein
VRRLLQPALVVAAAALLAGCGGGAEGAEPGTATLWVTRDRGEAVLVEREVDAGQTVLEALREHADVRTAYGGRFVQAIDGLEGSPDAGRDWFYFVNGVLADRGAAEYRLRPGDVAWWDHRAWVEEAEEVSVVVGAFPQPFLGGYAGERRPAAVTYELPAQREAAQRLGELLRAETVARAGEDVPAGANVLALVGGPERFTAEVEGPGGPVRFTFAGDADALADEPHRYRFRFEVRP